MRDRGAAVGLDPVPAERREEQELLSLKNDLASASELGYPPSWSSIGLAGTVRERLVISHLLGDVAAMVIATRPSRGRCTSTSPCVVPGAGRVHGNALRLR